MINQASFHFVCILVFIGTMRTRQFMWIGLLQNWGTRGENQFNRAIYFQPQLLLKAQVNVGTSGLHPEQEFAGEGSLRRPGKPQLNSVSIEFLCWKS